MQPASHPVTTGRKTLTFPPTHNLTRPAPVAERLPLHSPHSPATVTAVQHRSLGGLKQTGSLTHPWRLQTNPQLSPDAGDLKTAARSPAEARPR